jgi:NAD-dependent SIR2 family protein deacetylase
MFYDQYWNIIDEVFLKLAKDNRSAFYTYLFPRNDDLSQRESKLLSLLQKIEHKEALEQLKKLVTQNIDDTRRKMKTYAIFEKTLALNKSNI